MALYPVEELLIKQLLFFKMGGVTAHVNENTGSLRQVFAHTIFL